jgi:metal-sulfur cluster biosynthetic enzyme
VTGASGDPLHRLDAALHRVCDPCSLTAGVPLSLPDMGLVVGRGVQADADRTDVRVTIAVTGPGCTYVGLLVEAVQREVRREFGADAAVHVTVDPSVVWTEDAMTGPARRRLADRRRRTVEDLGLRPRMWQEALR